MLACADIEEGIVLRRAGVGVPILVFGALSVSHLDGVFEYSLTPTVSSPGAARAVQAAAARRGTRLGYHLKLDTGMNRLGFRHDNLGRTLPELLASPNLRLEGVFTHFATADVPESPVFNEQRLNFERALETMGGLVGGSAFGGTRPTGVDRVGRVPPLADPPDKVPPLADPPDKVPPLADPPDKVPPLADPPDRVPPQADPPTRIMVHACNSAALLRDSRVWYDAVRPGLLLYGLVPPPLASTIPLRPVMSLTSRVTAVKGLRPGEGVGYGWTYRAESPRTIAVVPAGYADGLDTRLSGRGVVLIRGKRVPIVGAVSMDMITVDVTDAGDVQPGDEVVILGRQGDASWQAIDAREVAAAIGTIPWEIVCRLGTRIERRYSEELGARS
jgi:alanine racemase